MTGPQPLHGLLHHRTHQLAHAVEHPEPEGGEAALAELEALRSLHQRLFAD